MKSGTKLIILPALLYVMFGLWSTDVSNWLFAMIWTNAFVKEWKFYWLKNCNRLLYHRIVKGREMGYVMWQRRREWIFLSFWLLFGVTRREKGDAGSNCPIAILFIIPSLFSYVKPPVLRLLLYTLPFFANYLLLLLFIIFFIITNIIYTKNILYIKRYKPYSLYSISVVL